MDEVISNCRMGAKPSPQGVMYTCTIALPEGRIRAHSGVMRISISGSVWKVQNVECAVHGQEPRIDRYSRTQQSCSCLEQDALQP